ncbi:MAG: MptD family putative ECF transporter S component [Tissierellia bacterium]|nr:MptD family putative ECF transporter S component [Tissierellia bacterium]
MKLKDFIKIVLFTVIGFILLMGGSLLSTVTGVFAFYLNTAFGTFLMAPVIFVMCHKVHKRGTLFIYYLFIGLVYSLMGFWAFMPFMILVAGLAEILVGPVENYHNDKKLSIMYIIVQFFYSLHGLLFLLILKGEGLVKLFPDMFDAQKVKELSDFYYNGKNLVILVIIQLVFSYLAAKFGVYVYKKFFAKGENQKSVLHG